MFCQVCQRFIICDYSATTPSCNDFITNVDLEARLIDDARDYELAQIKAFINSIQAAGEQLRQNANPQLVLEVLMLNIPRRKEGISVKYG